MLNILNDYEEFDNKVVNIRCYYDRYTRSWIIYPINKEGYQIGEAQYAGNKEDRDYILNNLKQDYKLT